MLARYRLFFLRFFGYILLLFLGMSIELKYNILTQLYYPIVEQQTESDVVVPIIEEKTIRYFELTEEDIFNVFYKFIHETIYGYRKHATEEYITDVACAYKDQLFYVPKPELIFLNVAKAKRESHFDIKASPETSSASGLGQVIWRWHADKLSKEYEWRDNIPITKEMLSTNIRGSVDAQYIVFENYFINSNGNYQKAVRSYFGNSQSDAAHRNYLLNLMTEYNLLTQRLFRVIMQKEPREKILKVGDNGEIIEEHIIKKSIIEQSEIVVSDVVDTKTL